MRLVFTVEYDGSRFLGYQIQPGTVTVQGELQRVMAQVFGRKTRAEAAGRTDRGVHALGQVVAVTVDSGRPLESILRSMNARLPPGLRVRSVRPAVQQFQPRHDALSRAYRYVMTSTLRESVFLLPYMAFVKCDVDWDRFQAAAARLVGTHNLVSFTTRPTHARTLDRTMDCIEVRHRGDHIFVDFRARSFLRGQIRNVMGWLLAVGAGVYPPEAIAELLTCEVKGRSVPPAPAGGLYLMQVQYPDERWPADSREVLAREGLTGAWGAMLASEAKPFTLPRDR